MYRYFIAFLLLGMGAAFAADPPAAGETDKVQLNRLTRTLLNQEQQIQQLEETIRQLRGEMEVLNHKMQQAEQTRRNLNTDIDDRLRRLEQNNVPQAVANNPPGLPAEPQIPAPAVVTQAPQLPALDMPPAIPPATIGTVPAGDNAQEAYQAAFNLLQSGNYQQAAEAFKALLALHGQSEYGDHAHYWLAESYYAMRDYTSALKVFNALLENYPDSRKRPHALLKTGYVYYELKDRAMARRVLENVRKNYPGTNTARLAEERLRILQGEGF